jgi:uncharacterized protein (TIGR02099 family)
MRRIAVAVFLLLAFSAAGLILTLRYSVLPDIERYHDDIVHSVGKAIGLTVDVGKIEADWHGLGPHLRLSDIRILDKQQRTTLALQRVDVVVSWMTLLAGELRLDSLEIDQPDLMIKRDVNGVLQISGVQLGGDSGNNNFSNMMLHQSRIVVRGAKISWLDEQQSKPLLVFDQVNLLIENVWNYHRFAIRAIPPADLSAELDVRGDFYGKSFDDMPSWEGEIYTQLEYADLAAWKTWLPLPYALRQGKGALRGWLGVEGGRISQITTDLALVDVQTRLAEDLPPLDVRVLRGRLAWRDVPHGFETSVRNFSLKLFNNFVLKPTDVFISFNKEQDAEFSTGEVRANLLELEGLGKLLDYLPLERKLKDQFAEFSPHGRIENLQAKWQVDAEKKLHYKAKAKFEELSLLRVGKLPGFSGLSGELNGNESSGALSINSHDLKFDAPQFMPQPLAIDTISGQASWRTKAGDLEVKVKNVAVSNADLSGTAHGSYETLANSPGKMDLTVHLTRASVASASKYIPLIALGADAQKWIKQSLLDGQSSDFNLRIKGDMNDFPFVNNKKGVFKIQARAKGVALEYVPGWPRIDNANADLLIQGKELAVTATSAMTAGAHLKNVKVSIADFLSKDLMLQINGEAEAENARALEFIHASPVRGYLDGFTDDIVARGNGRLSLKLDIPLSSSQPVKVAGSYHFVDSEIDFGKNLPTLRKTSGDLLFTESSVSSKNIVTQILGGPARLAVESGEGGAINVKLGGKANLAVLRELNPHPLLGKLSGDPAWNIEIGVHNKLKKVLLTSSLQGLQSDLPAPLAKRADESMPLRLEIKDLDREQESLILQYGSLLNASILRLKDEEGDWGIERGIINFGNASPKADRDGLWVIGTLPLVSVEGWGVLAGMGELTGVAGDDTGPTVSLAGADLSIQKLSGYGRAVNELHIKASSRNGMLMAQVAARELTGEVSWRAGGNQSGDNGRLLARLKNLDLGQADGDNGKKPQPETGSRLKVGADVELPVIDVTVDKLSFKGRQLGKLELLGQQYEQGYQLDHLRLTNSDGVLSVDGQWRMSEDTPQTQVNLKLEMSNAGNILARAGYPNSLKNGSGKMEGTFIWPGAPGMFSNANLDGKLKLDTGKGQFLQIDPGAGKLLSILSLQSLPKRITLDFEDVFSKGFEFDKFSGSANIKQGVIITDNLKLEGSAAKVSMAGQINLNDESQSLRVRIVPAVGDSVALVSALAITPVLGASVYLAGKILNDPLGQLVAFEYDVTGSWLDPKVEKVGGKKTSRQ